MTYYRQCYFDNFHASFPSCWHIYILYKHTHSGSRKRLVIHAPGKRRVITFWFTTEPMQSVQSVLLLLHRFVGNFHAIMLAVNQHLHCDLMHELYCDQHVNHFINNLQIHLSEFRNENLQIMITMTWLRLFSEYIKFHKELSADSCYLVLYSYYNHSR